jgi:phage terminase large subunit-like protein
MRRNKFRFFEDTETLDGVDLETAWPELRAALRQPANTQDLGLWRLAEDGTRLAARRPTLVRLTPRTEPRVPDFPDAA